MTGVTRSEAIAASSTLNRAGRLTERNTAGVQKLLHLLSLVDRAWFRDRHNMQFKLDATMDGPALFIARSTGQHFARWTAKHDTLVFTMATGDERRAETIDCAVSMTCEALDQARGRRN